MPAVSLELDSAPSADAPAVSHRFGPALHLPPGPVRDQLVAAFEWLPDRPDRGLAGAQDAQALAMERGDARGAAWAQALVGFAHFVRSDHRQALTALSEALAVLESLGDVAGRAVVLDRLAGVYTSVGQYEDALEASQQSLAAARGLGAVESEAWTLQGMANLMLDLDDPAQALDLAEQALAHFDALGLPRGRARALVVVGGARRRLGQPEAACAALEEALATARGEGTRLTEARVLDDLGRLDADAGRHERAINRYRDALAIREAVGNRQAQAASHLHLGEALTALGRLAEAVDTLTVGLALAQEAGAAPREAEVHLALAAAYEAAAEPSLALAHLRHHQHRREQILSAQARSRAEAMRMRAAAERAQRDAEMARVRTEELGATNRELEATLDRLRLTQNRLVQAEKMASLGRLSAGLAHEIRNPLNFVLNFAEVAVGLADDLRERLTADDVPDALAGDTRPDLDALVDSAGRVQLHARRAEGVVQSLVGHARRAPLADHTPVALPDLLDAVLLDAIPAGSPVQVRREVADGLPTVDGDAASLRQTVAAIVANALRALAEVPPTDAPPTLTLTARAAGTREQPAVEVVIADNGPGIAPEHCGRVFEPFFTTRPPGEGTGLGLALAYDAVVAGHGGRLTVRSQLGDGAAFKVWLPVAAVPEA